MEYSEEIANKIIKAQKLSPKTLLVWRTRGKIPDKYSDLSYKKPSPVTREKQQLKEDIIRILKSEKINRKALTSMTRLELKTTDVLRGKSSFSSEDLDNLKKAINKERILIKKCVEKLQNKTIFTDADSEDLKDVLTSPIIVLRYILGFTDKEDEARVFAWRNNKQEITNVLKKTIIDRLAIFLLETGL